MQAAVHHKGYPVPAHVRELVCCHLFETKAPRQTMKTFGKEGVCRRDAVWLATRDARSLTPLYRVDTTKSPMHPTHLEDGPRPAEMPVELQAFLDDLQCHFGLTHQFNHVVAHQYVDGNDVITRHHDKDRDITPGSVILSMSLGATRDFCLGNETFPLEDGDLVLLPYELNKQVKHAVPARRGVTGKRWSITARSIDTYFDFDTRKFATRYDADVRYV